MKLSRMQTLLLVWSVLVLTAVIAIRQVQLDERETVIVGAIEVVIAIITGVAFGLTANTRKSN
jgi:hypothetical protein